MARTRSKLAVYSDIVRISSDQIPPGPIKRLFAETREKYDGPLEIGEDLTTSEITDGVRVKRWSPFSVMVGFVVKLAVRCGCEVHFSASKTAVPPRSASRYSGKPAERRPSTSLARSPGRFQGERSRRLEIVSAGSTSRRRTIANPASSNRPASAFAATAMRSAGAKIGRRSNALLAQEDASSYRAAMKWADAVPACMLKICGSKGLRRTARAKWLIAASASPSQTRIHPLESQAAARFGLSARTRSIKPAPASTSPTTPAITWPPMQSATASSWPSSTARRGCVASRVRRKCHPRK